MDYAPMIEEAIKKFYATGADEAHSWLLQIQGSPEAWAFVWQLLHPSKPGEVQFYAATTLHTKIVKHWHEVPESEYLVLRDRIVTAMKNPSTSKVVLSRLCLSLAAVVANSCPSNFEETEGKTLVEELTECLPYNSPQTLELLLRVLTILPTELERRPFNSKNVKPSNLKNTKHCWSKTEWLLNQVFSMCNSQGSGDSNNNSLHLLTLECTLAWLKIKNLPLDSYRQIFQWLLSAAARFVPKNDEEENDNKAWDVVQECITLAITHYDIACYPRLCWEWSKSLVTLAQPHEKYYSQILVTLGESNSRNMLLALTKDAIDEERWISETLIELILRCSETEGRYPTEETRSVMPFGFWYTLQDDARTLDEPLDEKVMQAIKPAYCRLVQALLRKTTLPSSPSEAGSEDDQELFRCYRMDACDTYVYCYYVLRNDLLVHLGQRLTQLQNVKEEWLEVESTLHAFKALCDIDSETEYTSALMDIVCCRIPYATYPDEVLACACSTLGSYCDWLGQNPDPWLEKSLQLISLGLQQSPLTMSAASLSLKDISREAGTNMAPLAPALLDIIGRTVPTLPVGGREGLRLMFAAGKLIHSLSSMDQQLVYLNNTIGVCVVKLQDLVQNSMPPASGAVVNNLKMVTMFISSLEGSIGKSVLDGLLPLFNLIVNHSAWSRDEGTLEAMHECAMKSVSSLANPETEIRPLLPILLTSYKTQPHPEALKLLQTLAIVIGRDKENVVGSVFAEISRITLNGFAQCQSVGGNLSELSELLAAYLSLLCNMCRKNSSMLLNVPDQITEMLQCGMTCLTLPEVAVVKAASLFLTQAIKVNPHMMTYIQPIGQELVCILIRCSACENSRNVLEHYADVLFALNRSCKEWIHQWIKTAFDTVKLNLSDVHKIDNIKNISTSFCKGKSKICEALQMFSMQCRQVPAVL